MNEVIKLSSPGTKEFWEIPVLYEDGQLLALSKPARLLTSPDPHDPEPRPNLMELLHRDIERGAPWAKSRGLAYLMNAHWLDFETSGVLLLAKDKPSLTALANQFGAEKTQKVFVALVRGTPEAESFSTDAQISPHPTQPGEMRVDFREGKKSRTEFSVRERFPGCLLLDCRPRTDRPHQIRVHLKHLHLPIVGDAVYGGPPLLLSKLKPVYRLKPGHVERPLMDRVALHLEQLTIAHPVSGTELKIESPWPRDLAVAVKYLRRYAQ